MSAWNPCQETELRIFTSFQTQKAAELMQQCFEQFLLYQK